MRLNLFKSIVSLLVLSASSFTIAHADTDIPLTSCKSQLTCQETNSTFCSAPNVYVNDIAGTYQKCPNCTNDGTFSGTKYCGTYAAVYYGCYNPGPGAAYTKAEWTTAGTDYFNYRCDAVCSCNYCGTGASCNPTETDLQGCNGSWNCSSCE